MTDAIKQRIEQINKGEIPQGYQQTRAGIAPNDWAKGRLSDILYNEKRTVKKPQDGYWRIGIRSHAKGTFHEYVENPDTIGMDELYVVNENDLIVNITFAWEHAIALADENDDGLLVSHRFPTYVFKKGQIPCFYKNIVVQNRFKELLALISPGGAGRNRVMSKKDFLQLPCFIPPFEEQQKIAEILMQCDKVIKLYEQEIDELKKLKKAYLRKMFPQKGENVPELRFAGFTDPWEQRKANELCSITTGKSNTQDQVKNGLYPFFTRSDTPIRSNKYLYDCEAVITIGDGNIGQVFHYINGKFDLHQRCYKMADFNGIYGKYFYYYFSTNFYNRAKKMTAKATVDSVRLEMISGMNISFPRSIKEQKKIAEFLTEFDNLIILHQRKLEEQQKQKKSLMQLLLTGIVRVKI